MGERVRAPGGAGTRSTGDLGSELPQTHHTPMGPTGEKRCKSNGGGGIRTRMSFRAPVVRTLRVLNVSALHASTLETHPRFPSESL